MKNNKNQKLNKSLGIQLAVVLVIFMVAVTSTLLGYVHSYKSKAEVMVYEDISSTVEGYADDMQVQIGYCEDIAKVAADLISEDNGGDEDNADETDIKDDGNGRTRKVIDELYSLGYAEDVLVVDVNGQGFGAKETAVNLSVEAFWKEVDTGLDSQMIACVSERFGNCLMVVKAADDNGVPCMVVAVYSFDKYVKNIKAGDLGVQSITMVVTRNGDVISANRNNSPLFSATNILDVSGIGDADNNKFKNSVLKGEKSYADVMLDSGNCGLVSIPIGDYPVSTVSVVGEDYLNLRMQQEIKQLVELEKIVFVCLFGLMIAIAIIFARYILRADDNKQKLEERADTDLLTGLNNKIATERKIREYIESHPDESGMLIVFDIDKFKKINDTQGHAFGDEVLKTLGERISGQFRVTDIIGRIGGDEFMIYLKNIPSEEIAKKEAEKLMLFFQDFKAGSEYIKYSATASVGVAMYPEDGTNFEQLYKAADDALYYSKDNGRNQLNFHNAEWGTIKK